MFCMFVGASPNGRWKQFASFRGSTNGRWKQFEGFRARAQGKCLIIGHGGHGSAVCLFLEFGGPEVGMASGVGPQTGVRISRVWGRG